MRGILLMLESIVYARTIRGNKHYQSGQPCQDSNSFIPDEDSSFKPIQSIAIADGHGGSPYLRSKEGADIATSLMKQLLFATMEELIPTFKQLDKENAFIKDFIDNKKDEQGKRYLSYFTKIATFEKKKSKTKDEKALAKLDIKLAKLHKSQEDLRIKQRQPLVEHTSIRDNLLKEVESAIVTVKKDFLKQWKKKVIEHLENNPVSVMEMEVSFLLGKKEKPSTFQSINYVRVDGSSFTVLSRKCPDDLVESLKETPQELYGTTILAAASYLRHHVFLQLGDGDIYIIKDKDTAVDAFPNKEILSGSYTYSVCSKDAMKHFDSRYINEPILGTILSTDGVSKSFNEEIEHAEFALKIYKRVHKEPSHFKEDLPIMLRNYTDITGDDCTVAFLLNDIDEFTHDKLLFSTEGEDIPSERVNYFFNNYSLLEETAKELLSYVDEKKPIKLHNFILNNQVLVINYKLFNLSIVDNQLKVTKKYGYGLVSETQEDSLTYLPIKKEQYNYLVKGKE